MSLLTVGLSHHTAPIGVLERAAVSADDLPKLLDELLSGENVTEALLLSTCNRIEVYAVVETFHGGLAHVSAVLAHHGGWASGSTTRQASTPRAPLWSPRRSPRGRPRSAACAGGAR